MSQVITDAFSSYWQQCLVEQTPVVLDEFVLAHIPGLDPDAPISPASGLPPADQIVHRHAVDQRGRISNDAVAYSIVMDTTVGDFTFNAMYLINTGLNLVGMIVHKGEETKLATDPASGQTGNSLVKSMLMEYDRAAEASQTVIDASTWQIDYAARLRGMDDDLRRQAMGTFGHAAFYGDGFKLVNAAGRYKVQPGQGYVGGLLVSLTAEHEVTPGAKPVGLWLDVHRAGSLLSPWVNHITLTLSTADLVDYVDANGYSHFVTKLATINADDSVTDTRARRTLTLTGDVTGQASFNGPDSIELEVHVEDNSHGHTINNVEGLQEALDGKAATSHTHTPAEAGAAPVDHTHTAADVGAFPSWGGGSGEDAFLRDPGVYDISSPASTPNWPLPDEGGTLLVQNHGSYRTRIAIGAGSADMFISVGTEAAPTPWKQLYHEGFKPSAADTGAVSKAGDTMTGKLIIAPDTNNPLVMDVPAGKGAFILSKEDGVNTWYVGIGSDGSSDVFLSSYTHGTSIALKSDHIALGKDPRAGAAQGTNGASLTRKDWVDAHKWTAAAGNSDIVAGSYGQVGTCALLWGNMGSTSIGHVSAGSALSWADAEGNHSGNPAGTWKQLGHRAVPATDNYGSMTTQWIRTDAASLFEQQFKLSAMTWDNAEHSSLTAIVTFADTGETMPLTLSREDTEAHGRWLFAMARDGEFGSVAEYVPPTPLEVAARDNPPMRRNAMMLATTNAQHFEMMGDAAQATTWRTYYQGLYALASTPEWPQVEQWPTAPALAA